MEPFQPVIDHLLIGLSFVNLACGIALENAACQLQGGEIERLRYPVKLLEGVLSEIAWEHCVKKSRGLTSSRIRSLRLV